MLSKKQKHTQIKISPIDNNSSKSEEVQAIIERMPTNWVKWIVLCLGILLGIILLLSFLIEYSDTVDGEISVTSINAPVRLVANSNGRIHLLKENKSILKAGDVVSFLETGANYQDVLWLDKEFKKIKEYELSKDITLPDTLILGELSGTYHSFVMAYLQYKRISSSKIYSTMRQKLQEQINSDQAIIYNLDNEVLLKDKILKRSEKQLKKDSILLKNKGISENEYQKQHNDYLLLQEALLGLRSNKLIKISEINRNQLEIQRILLEETELKEKTFTDVLTRKNELSNALNQWKERYLQITPIDGELEYLGFWRNNSFIQAGQELFSIIPDKNKIVGEVVIPSYGAGKVKVGQRVNVKINNFPYDEYGMIKGVVKSISRITNIRKTTKGDLDTYLVQIFFPNGAVTNFGKVLPLDFDNKGTAEIITKRKRLIQRLFNNLKAQGEK